MDALKSAIRDFDAGKLDSCTSNLWAHVSCKITPTAREHFEPVLRFTRESADVQLKYFVFVNMLCNSERELDVKEMACNATGAQIFSELEVAFLSTFFKKVYEICRRVVNDEPVDLEVVNNEFFKAFNECVP